MMAIDQSQYPKNRPLIAVAERGGLNAHYRETKCDRYKSALDSRQIRAH